MHQLKNKTARKFWWICPVQLYEVLGGLWVYRYFKLGILARRATAHLAQLADQHESHQAASQAFRKVPSLGLWPVTSGLKFIFGYFLGGAANARRVVKKLFRHVLATCRARHGGKQIRVAETEQRYCPQCFMDVQTADCPPNVLVKT